MDKVFQRSFSEVRALDKDTRRVTFVASDASRDSYGTVCNPEGWNLDRFNSNGIIGYQHDVYGGECDPDKVIGKGRAYREGDQLLVDIEFEPADLNPLAEKIYKKLCFGSLKAVSVGFVPTGKGHFGEGDEAFGRENETFYFEGQELLEVSVVNIPANPKALKKSIEDDKATLLAYIEDCKPADEPEEKSAEVEPVEEPKEETPEVPEAETEEPKEPEAEEPKEPEEEPKEEPKEENEDSQVEKSLESNTNNLKSPKMEKRNLGEVFTAQVREALNSHEAIAVAETREYISGTEAGNVAAVTIGDIIEPLEKGMILDKLGCKVQYGLEGDWKYPVVAAIEASVAGEVADVSDSEITLSKVEPDPQRVSLSIAVSNKAMAKGGDTLRDIVIRQLGLGVQRLLNDWMFKPSAIATGVNGLFVSPSYTGTTAANTGFTWADVNNLRAGVDANGCVPDETAAYVMSNAMAAALRATARGSGDRMVLEGNEIDGVPVFITEYAPANTLYFGYFSYAMVGQFGDMSILVDPYTLSKNNQTRFVLNTHFDIKAARAQAFGKMTLHA